MTLTVQIFSLNTKTNYTSVNKKEEAIISGSTLPFFKPFKLFKPFKSKRSVDPDLSGLFKLFKPKTRNAEHGTRNTE